LLYKDILKPQRNNENNTRPHSKYRRTHASTRDKKHLNLRRKALIQAAKPFKTNFQGLAEPQKEEHVLKKSTSKTFFWSGNEACAEAAITAGCRFFAGYPITPSSEIAEH
jgi:hypothetical protein